ncbi:MAG: OmpA family protein [Chlorobi bacterium]|nr:OmpA family protein [Chlorobiota bacterium]
MKSIRLTLVISFLLALLPSLMFAQRNPAKSADDAFDALQYSIAIDKYKKAYTKIKKNKEEKNRITSQLAECYRLTSNYKRAEISYKQLIRRGWDKKNPDVLLRYAEMLKINGKYDESIVQYHAYADKVPDDPRGKEGAESAALVAEWVANPSKYEVSNVKKINSRESDFAAAFTSANYNEIAFGSTRDGATGKLTDDWTGQNFSDIFVAKLDRKNEWSAPVLFDKSETVNTKANEGTPAFSSDFKTLYFTRCPNDIQKKSGCQIYKSRRSGRNWQQPEMVEINGIDTMSTIGHPTLSENELIIYFSADRKGGFGGKDIWVAMRESKKEAFGRPLNIGDVVNTKGDEMFPFLRNDTTLYFASDGHGGMGGLDIFMTTVDTSGKWGKPVNLKYPINSSFDDFAIIFHPEEEYGYLSSNRKGSRGKEDIYYFIEPPLLFTISGTVTDDRTLFAVENANVQLVGSSGLSVTTITNPEGYFSFGKSQVKPNTTYDIIVSKPNYLNNKGTITTVGVEFSKDFEKNIVIQPIPAEPVVLPDILYDLAKWDLKPQYQDSLQGLIQTLRDNPNLVIELASHTDFRDSYERNDILSQRRAQSVVDYLIIRGIEPARLVAKGYGERVPRILKKTVSRNGVTFEEGTELTEDFINSLSTEKEKELAHQLNRRTEFRVLRKDYVPSATNIDIKELNVLINPDDNSTIFKEERNTGTFISTCVIMGYYEEFAYDRHSEAMISLDKALTLLKGGAIGKEDFEGNAEEILVDNSIRNNAVIVIPEITIANKTVKDVRLKVKHKLRYGLVFGDNALKLFGNFSFNKKTHKLTFEK